MSFLKFTKKLNCYALNVHTALVALNYLTPQLLPNAKLLMYTLHFYATLKSVTEAYRTEDSLVFSSLQNKRFSCLQLFTENGLHELSYLTNDCPWKQNGRVLCCKYIHQKPNEREDTLFFNRHNTSPLRDHTG